MRWDNTDLKVGLLVVGALVVALVSFFWVSQLWRRNVAPLYTDVADVQGIGKESPVFLNGFNVGRVSDVSPRVTPDGQLLFRLRMDISWRLDNGAALPLHQGLRARVVPPALDIGRGTIVLENPDSSGRLLRPGEVVPSAQTGGTTNRMQLVVDSVGRDLRITLASVQQLVSQLDGTVKSATATMRSANGVFQQLHDQVPGIVGNLNTTLASADSMIRGMHDITPATVATLDSMRAMLGDSRVALARATQFIDSNQPQLTSTIANLDQATAVLNNLLREVSRRPFKALTGVRPPTFPAPAAQRAGTTATKTASGAVPP